jgi:uncharacterized protein (DUF427 family)
MTTSPHAHRLRIGPATGHVVVRSSDVVLAETDRAVELREGSRPVRYYIPPEDIAMQLLTSVSSTSHCPFKGDARYWSYDDVDIAWSYETPIEGARDIAGLIAFYSEKTEVTVDNVRV